MEQVTIFEVGGSIRDKLLGLENKDRDFAVECESFQVMHDYLIEAGFHIFLIKDEYLTIRARFPVETDERGKLWVGDFVMCRKDGYYSDGRRPDEVIPGTIYDDLARRDFTVNAMARSINTGELLDPHGGQHDLIQGRLRCVGPPGVRIQEDALRAIRAIRFRVMKKLFWSASLEEVMRNTTWLPDALASISTERISEELRRCFAHDTLTTFDVLADLPAEFRYAIFKRRTDGNPLWLTPTMGKARGH